MVNLGNQITLWRKSRRLTQEALQDLCGWGAGNGRISHYEKGRSQPGMKELSAISKSLGIDLKTLIFERPNVSGKLSGDNVNLNLEKIVNVPVYSIETAHRWRDLGMDGAIDYIALPKHIAPDQVFIVPINDNSCLPMYGPGTSFVISHQKPIAGDLVLAILPDGQNAIRYYKRPTPESYSLVPINDDYAPYELNDTSRDNIIGTVCLIISLPPNARK